MTSGLTCSDWVTLSRLKVHSMRSKSLSRVIIGIIWGLLIGWIAWALRRWLMSMTRRQAARAQRTPDPSVQKPTPLFRDPWCGTYVAPEIALPFEQAGQIEHFCSAECRER